MCCSLAAHRYQIGLDVLKTAVQSLLQDESWGCQLAAKQGLTEHGGREFPTCDGDGCDCENALGKCVPVHDFHEEALANPYFVPLTMV